MCVRSHEAVVVETWSQAGRAQTKSFALGAAGTSQDAFILGGQVGPKQGLQQLKHNPLNVSAGKKQKHATQTKPGSTYSVLTGFNWTSRLNLEYCYKSEQPTSESSYVYEQLCEECCREVDEN